MEWESVRMPVSGRTLLACGGDTAVRACLTRGRDAFLSGLVKDLSDYDDYELYRKQIEDMQNELGIKPELVAHDMHPDYRSTRYAIETGLTSVAVQHHHAHIASCMVEHELTDKVIGIAMDGTGYGPDGTVWGGEFLLADLQGYERAGHLKQYAMPGSDEAVRNPLRMAFSMMHSELGNAAPPLDGLSETEAGVLKGMIEGGTRSPLSSSAGRLFDAVAALTGICTQSSFSGEPAIELEKAAAEGETGQYEFEIITGEPSVLSFGPMIRQIVNDNTDPSVKSAKFHNTVAEGIFRMCVAIREQTGISKVATAGGVFFNRLISSKLKDLLQRDGFELYNCGLVSTGDAGLAVGQAAIALAQSASTV